MTIPKEIQEGVVKLRKQGYFFRDIAKKLNLSVGSSHKYGSKIKLSPKTKEILQDKEKKSRRKPIILTKRMTIEKVKIIAHLLFDGSVSRGIIRYTNSSIDLINKLIINVKETYGVKPDQIIEENGKFLPKYTVSYFYMEIVEDLLRYVKSFSTNSHSASIPKKVIDGSTKFKREFLRAFWEDEGCVTIDGDILGRIKSEKIRDQLVKMHHQLGIRCTPYDCKDGAFGIYIKRSKKNLVLFKNVGFEHSIITRGKNIGVKKISLFENIYHHYLTTKI